jgi:alpha-L-rhamnosidase
MIKQINSLFLTEISTQVKMYPMALGMILAILLAITGCSESSHRQLIKPVSLRCEHQVNPKGVDIRKPALSWLFEIADTSLRGQKQSSYQVLVASSPEILSKDTGDLWNSGLVKSDQSVQVLYNGRSLNSRARCFWKVRVSDLEGNLSGWSDMASWEMGLMNSYDWQGDWIGWKEKYNRKPREKLNGYCSGGVTSQDNIKWVQIDLDEITGFDRVILHPAFPMEYPDCQIPVSNPGFGFPLRFRLDVSNDPDFLQYKTIFDKTDSDFPNPGWNEVTVTCPGQLSRYVRLTATRLWNSRKGDRPFYFALGEMQIFSENKDIALNKIVKAMDSQEGCGWSRSNLTDGLNLIGEDEEGHEALLFRKEIEIDRKVKFATAFICGLGYSELNINGKKVGNHVLDPGFTNYSKEVLYVTYDVTDYFKKGKNCIGIILGGGWYDPATPDVWGFHIAPWVAPPKLLLNVVLEFADGTQTVIVSDQTWKVSTGPIVFNSIRGGEYYDARLEKPGWNLPGYIETGWNAVKKVPPPGGNLVSQHLPPIRATRLISPISLTEPLPGIYVYDIGENIAGWVRLNIRGESGDTVSLFYNEQLNSNGTVLYGPHSWWTYGHFQTDKFISCGKGLETFEPRFTYHGFRYIQVNGLKNKPVLNDLKGVCVHTDPVPAGEFSCSNPEINKVQELIIRAQLNNLHSIPTDCPHREKIGWMGDGLITMEEAICNFEMSEFYSKWFRDMLDAQEADGHVPPIVPNPGWIEATSAKNPRGAIPVFSDPWWGGAVLMVPWNLYLYYGDRRYLETGYDAMKAYVDWIGTRTTDYIFVASLGDWIEPAAFSGAKVTPKDQIGTSAYFYFARFMSRIAIMLDKSDDAEKYSMLAKNILESFNKKFFNAQTGQYTDYSQLAQVIPLLFGIVPEGKDKLVEDQLINLITKKNNNHLSTGFIGTPLLFKLLTQLGYADLAYTIATQEDQPGWFYMLRNGATTTWEVWDAMAQVDHSRDHPAFGSIGAWYYQSLAGIQPDPEGPGFKKIIIKPEVVGDLTWARAYYYSIHGKISCGWKREMGKLTLNIEVPVNTSARVYIPADSLDSIFEGNQTATSSTGISYIKKERNKYVFEVGSGIYRFISNYTGK